MSRASKLTTRLERCAAADTETVTLDRDDCRLLLALWTAANEVHDYYTRGRDRDNIGSYDASLRRAIRALK